jgi:hypothetical protein
LRPAADSFPHEIPSLATLAPPSPPNTALSVVIWMAARWGLASPPPRIAHTLVAVIWMKSFGTPPPMNTADVPRVGAMYRSMMRSASS